MALTDSTHENYETRAIALLKEVCAYIRKPNEERGEHPLLKTARISQMDLHYYEKRAAEYMDRECKWKVARDAGDWANVNIHSRKMRCIVDDYVLLIGKHCGVKPDPRPNIKITKSR